MRLSWPVCCICGVPMLELTRLVETREWCHSQCAWQMEQKERRDAQSRWATT